MNLTMVRQKLLWSVKKNIKYDVLNTFFKRERERERERAVVASKSQLVDF